MQKIYQDPWRLSINLQELNLIQAGLFLIPKKEMTLELKRRFGILSLLPLELEQDLKSINSPLRRYLSSMMLSQCQQAQILLSNNFLRFLLKRQKLAFRRRLLRFLARLRRRLQGGRIRHVLKRKIRVLTYATYLFFKEIKKEDFHHLKSLLLESHRYALLKCYLPYADSKLLYSLFEMINAHINMLKEIFEKYEELIKKNQITQADFLDNWLLSTINRIKVIQHEIPIELTNTDAITQADIIKKQLLKILTNDITTYHQLEQINESYSHELNSSNNNAITPDNDAEHNLILKNTNPMQLQILFDKLQAHFTDFLLPQKEIIVYEAHTILMFIEKMMKTINRPVHQDAIDALTRDAILLLKKLNEHEKIQLSFLRDYLAERFEIATNTTSSQNQAKNIICSV